MVFQCQKDSFLREYTTKVKTCEKATFTSNYINERIDGYAITLDDTILLPEGGGQPADGGTINGLKVHHVKRLLGKAIHYMDQPLQLNEEVHQILDWTRRFDHMQQHSGQHLISALIESKYDIATISWHMSNESSYVELNTTQFTTEQLNAIGEQANEAIRKGLSVTVQVYPNDTAKEELEQTRSVRGLPQGHKGDIRVITIDGIDANMCCGTHVSNLSQLQIVHLMYTEKSKRSGNTLLHFQIGQRCQNQLNKYLTIEQRLNTLLRTNSNQHVEFVEKLLQNVKNLNKVIEALQKDIVCHQVQKLSLDPTVKYFSHHQSNAGVEYLNNFMRELNRNDLFVFLSIGDESGSGNILLSYEKEVVLKELGDSVCKVLNGKGALNKGRYHAKVNQLSKRQQADEIIMNYINIGVSNF